MGLRTQLGPSSEQLEQLADVVAWAYAESRHDAHLWLSRSDVANVRAGWTSGKVIAGLVEVPMGQWFGGRSVPTLGIAGVAIAAEARGAGHAIELLRQSLAEARSRGVALSTLYPSTPKLYRKLGYEYAGGYCRSSMPLATELRRRSDAVVTELGSAHRNDVEALYRGWARRRTGYFDRGAFLWDYVRVMKEKPVRGVVALGRDGIEGYLYVAQHVKDGTHHDLVLKDFVATTPDALAALLQFLTRHSTTAQNAIWYGGTVDARLFGLADCTPTVTVSKYWMLRVVNVEAALQARGYAPISVSVNLHVVDEVLPENSGSYRLHVDRGVPNVSRTNEAGVSITPGGLAALYSGAATAEDLAIAGQITADADILGTLSALFAGTSPITADFF